MKLSILLILLVHTVLSEKVLFVFEMFRHGARDPISDEWKGDKMNPDGELTAVGMRQHYNLGKVMKKKFFEDYKLIKEQFDPKEIYVRSTAFPRVIQSAQSNLLGMFENTGPELPQNLADKYLFPPVKGYNETQTKGAALPNSYQPVPIQVFPENIDKSLGAYFNCPTFNKYRKDIQNSNEYSILKMRTLKTRAFIGRKFLNSTNGVASIDEAFNFADILRSNEWFGIQIPSSITPKMREDLELIYHVGMYFGMFGSKTQQQLASGILFQDVLNYFGQVISQNTTLKLVIYSAHDVNIASFLNSLNFSNPLCRLYFKPDQCFEYPGFASHVLLELVEDDEKQHFVRAVFNGEILKVFSYNEFVEEAKKIIPDDYDKLCNVPPSIYMLLNHK